MNTLLELISPTQMRMARAALDLNVREFGKATGISGMAVSRYERGDERVISVATARRVTEWLTTQRIYLGPKDGVCLGSDAFAQERWFATACYQLLKEHGIAPGSAELIKAHDRAVSSNASLSGGPSAQREDRPLEALVGRQP